VLATVAKFSKRPRPNSERPQKPVQSKQESEAEVVEREVEEDGEGEKEGAPGLKNTPSDPVVMSMDIATPDTRFTLKKKKEVR